MFGLDVAHLTSIHGATERHPAAEGPRRPHRPSSDACRRGALVLGGVLESPAPRFVWQAFVAHLLFTGNGACGGRWQSETSSLSQENEWRLRHMPRTLRELPQATRPTGDDRDGFLGPRQSGRHGPRWARPTPAWTAPPRGPVAGGASAVRQGGGRADPRGWRPG